MPSEFLSGISSGFPELFQSEGQIPHVLLTRSPLIHFRRNFIARLACVKHAASVRPEPGSNSPKILLVCLPSRVKQLSLFVFYQRNRDILKSTEHINEQREKNADELKIGIDFMARC